MTTTPQNRRKFKRLPYNGIGMLYVLKEAAGESTARVCVKSQNVSGGGVVFTGLQPFNPGTLLGMTLSTVFDTGHERVFGRVIRSREIHPGFFETALEFILVGQPDYEAVSRVLSS